MVELELTVGLVVTRYEAASTWGEPIWMPFKVLENAPETPAWSVIFQGMERVSFYAGAYPVKLYSTSTAYYRDNLLAERPRLWVVMRPNAESPPVEICLITADPTEGEGATETGTAVVEVVDMPAGIAAEIAAFVEAHHVERPFEKRRRDKRQPDMMDPRGPARDRKPGGSR